MNYLKIKILCCILGLIVTPTIWLKIGPLGYLTYGPNVPDIYIFGFAIIGKDRNDWGVVGNIQLSIMTVTLLIALLTLLTNLKPKLEAFLVRFNFIVFILFPCWLFLLTPHIINNSDGADLTIIPHIGMVIYAFLLYFSYKLIKMSDFANHNTTKAI